MILIVKQTISVQEINNSNYNLLFEAATTSSTNANTIGDFQMYVCWSDETLFLTICKCYRLGPSFNPHTPLGFYITSVYSLACMQEAWVCCVILLSLLLVKRDRMFIGVYPLTLCPLTYSLVIFTHFCQIFPDLSISFH